MRKAKKISWLAKLLFGKSCLMPGYSQHLDFFAEMARKWGKPDENGVVKHVKNEQSHQADVSGTNDDDGYMICPNCGRVKIET